MNNNETANNEVKTIEVKKSELIKIRSGLVKRLKEDCKEIKLIKLNEAVLSEVHDQASCIDACIRLKMNVDNVAVKLVDMGFCATIKQAYARIRRHFASDKASRVIKRNIALNAKA